MRYRIPPVVRKRILLISMIGIAVLLIFAVSNHPVKADVAPPKAPPGANPEVETVDTKVRMMAEKVVIDIQDVKDIDEMGSARVWAEFQMENQGTSPERLMVRFPIAFSDGFSGYPEIEDMMVYVDNVNVSYSRTSLDGEPENWDDPIKWVEFEVLFPPGENVEIEVDYTLRGTGEYPFVSYAYLLETGAGWYGTIGRAEIIVRLPYLASNLTVFFDSSPGWGGTTPGGEVSGQEITWVFEDFEPTYENNISVAIVWPSVWNAVHEELVNLEDFPSDGESWGRLGKLYKEVSRLRRGSRNDPGGQRLFDLSQEAYQTALIYLPNDALWRAGYADLLVWDSIYQYPTSAEARSRFMEGLLQMYLAYTIDPDQPYIQEYLSGYIFPSEAVGEEDGEFIFYWLTQTPTLMPESEAAVDPSPTKAVLQTATVEPTSAPAPTEQPESPPSPPAAKEGGRGFSLPFCGSVIMFPLVLGVFAWIPQLRLKKGPRARRES